MDQVIQFLDENKILIYLILGLIALIYLIKVWQSYRIWRSATFGLERDNAVRSLTGSATILVLALGFAFGQVILTSFVGPNLARTIGLPTPTIDLLATPTITLSSSNLTPTANGPTITPPPVSSNSQGCIPGQVEWTFPKPGGELKGTVKLKGTVNVPNLGFYKYEYSKPGGQNWLSIAAGNEKKIDAELGGSWNTAPPSLVPGDYNLRLVVTDNTAAVVSTCVISVRVVAP